MPELAMLFAVPCTPLAVDVQMAVIRLKGLILAEDSACGILSLSTGRVHIVLCIRYTFLSTAAHLTAWWCTPFMCASADPWSMRRGGEVDFGAASTRFFLRCVISEGCSERKEGTASGRDNEVRLFRSDPLVRTK